ncbi:MAG TPA: hypothetical protein DCY88_06695 [Cyanobacteria bacterium UBA11372]|nr:hypothetical protein [Cyanobacteria bacterium UBA11372]
MRQRLFGAIALTTLISLAISEKVHAVGITLDRATDVGEFIGNAGITNTQPFGTPLTSIAGNLGNGDNIDLYQIYLPSGTFTAAVGSTNLNTQLFLFDSGGIGVIGNDDDVAIASFDPNISRTISNAGNYYLGISIAGFEPQSSGGLIFDFIAADPTTPNGPGAASPLSSWSTGPLSPGQEGYTINVSGAQFVGGSVAAVPFDFNPTFGVTILGLWASWKYLKNRKKS